MEPYKKEFIEFMVDCNVLKFGDFETKSGRKTPFFVNTGFVSGVVSPITTGIPLLIIPAFSLAIFSNVLPRNWV